MWKNKKVSLIFPTYNEKDSIGDAIVEFEKADFIDEIIVVNNNAAVGTSEEVARVRSKITREVFETKQGYGFAIRRGFKEAKGDLIIVSEPDGTFFGSDVVKLLSYSDEFDVVYGSRTSRQLIWKGANMGAFLRWGNFFVAKLTEVLFNTISLTDVGCTMRLVSRKVINKIEKEFTVGREHFGPEMMLLTFIHDFKSIQIPVNYTERIGESSVTGDYFKAFKLGIVMILLILKYRFSYFGKFHIPTIKKLFGVLQDSIYKLLRLDNESRYNPFKIPFIYILAFAHFAFFFWLTYIRWKAHTPTMDYHAYIQMLWNTVNGKMLVYNQSRGTQISFFKLHFAPILIPLAWIYKLVPHPLTLYFIFHAFIAASLVPIYKMAQKILKSSWFAYLITFIYVIYPPFVWNHRQGFAEEAFALPLLVFAFYFLYEKKIGLYVLFSFLTLTLRVNMAMPVFMLGLYAFYSKRAKTQGIFFAALSLFWIFYVMKFINPAYMLPGEKSYLLSSFSAYGDNVSEIAHSLIFEPTKTMGHIFGETKIRYLKQLFFPTFMLPFLTPSILVLSLPIMLISMMSSNPRLASTVAYYHASVIPFIFYALIFGIKKIKKLKRGDVIVGGILLIMLLNLIIINVKTSSGAHLPISKYFNKQFYEVTSRDAQVDLIISNIPSTLAVGTSNAFMEHIAERSWYYSHSLYKGYLPDVILFDVWIGNEYEELKKEIYYDQALLKSNYALFARKDLFNKYDINETSLDLKNFPANQNYLAILSTSDKYTSSGTGIGRDQPVDITSDVVFAQKITFDYADVISIDIPIEKINQPKSGFIETLKRIIKPPRGKLKIQILENPSNEPFGKEVWKKRYSFNDFTSKTDILRLYTEGKKFDVRKKYWLVISLDKDDGKNYERYNIYRIYTAASKKDTDKTNPKVSTDLGIHWKNSVGSKDLLYNINYKPKDYPTLYPKNRFFDGTYIFKGSPDFISEKITRINNISEDYNNLIIIGKERVYE